MLIPPTIHLSSTRYPDDGRPQDCYFSAGKNQSSGVLADIPIITLCKDGMQLFQIRPNVLNLTDTDRKSVV